MIHWRIIPEYFFYNLHDLGLIVMGFVIGYAVGWSRGYWGGDD